MKLLYETTCRILVIESENELSIDQIKSQIMKFNVNPFNITRIKPEHTLLNKYVYSVKVELETNYESNE